MRRRVSGVVAVGLLVVAGLLVKGALAKNKNDKVLPDYILRAHTVAVMIDPSAGLSVDDPRANQVAQKDVETALANWGRFQPLMSPEGADLVIVIRKGHGRLADGTISDPRQNNRAGVINPTDDGVMVGAQHGTQPVLGTQDGTGRYPQGQTPQNQVPQSQIPHPEMEIGGAEDSFAVFDGKAPKPMDSAPGWRYMAQDGLRAHNVPAVDEFKKAVAAGDKAAAAAAAAKKP
jgi:hypothetical protein